MTSVPDRQQDRVLTLLKERGIVRSSELTEAGVTATTVSRMKEKGLILRLGRGLYQLPGASLDSTIRSRKQPSSCREVSSVSRRRWRFMN